MNFMWEGFMQDQKSDYVCSPATDVKAAQTYQGSNSACTIYPFLIQTNFMLVTGVLKHRYLLLTARA